jgi:hypothetical protein
VERASERALPSEYLCFAHDTLCGCMKMRWTDHILPMPAVTRCGLTGRLGDFEDIGAPRATCAIGR